MKRILYIQLFLIISSLVFYSCDRELISSGYPNVATLSAEDQGEKIVFSGELKNDEDILIDEAGFIWQSSDDPVSKPGFQVKSEKPGSGNFSAEISWSVANDKNYVLRAYAKCGDKTVYGEKLDFKTALIRPCQLFRIEPDSAFRGDTIKFIGRGFNQTLQYNKVYIDGKNSVITRINDSILTCVVPVELTKGSKVVNIVVNGIGGDFSQKFKLLLPPAPQVVTKSAQNIQLFSARTEGSVDPNGLPCIVTFEYGLTTSYGLSVNAVPGSVSGGSVINVAATIANLTQNSTYHYRIKAVSESGISYGEDMTFKTLELPPIPIISSLSATTIKYGNILTVYGQNLNAVSSVLIGSTAQSITVTPINKTATTMEIEIYNQVNPTQLLGFTSFRVGLVYYSGVIWSELVIIGNSWTRVADLPAAARYKAGFFTIGGNIYIGCGASEGVTLKDFWKYDPLSNLWSRMADFPGVPRVYALGTADNSFGYMGTGHTADNSSRAQLYDFYKYNPGNNLWSNIPDYPDPINNFFWNYGVSVNGHAYVSLSNVVQNTREIINDSWISHPNVSDLMNSGGNSVFVFGNSFYVICGYRFNTTVINRAVWEYNTLTATWTRKTDFPGPARNLTMSFSIGNYGYMACGTTSDNQQFKDVWRYDPANDKWIRIDDFPGGIRSHGVGASSGEFGYAGLGVKLSTITYYNDFWRFDPQAH
jgi:hypothetical protein